MKSPTLNQGIRIGVTFGVVIVAMFLIGFTMAGAGLVGKLLGASSSYGTPSLAHFALFMILIGIWAVVSAAPRSLQTGTFKSAAEAGLTAGFVSGLFATLVGLIFGTLLLNRIDPRTYLPSVSPESIKLF